jgi:hypothetical protein
MTDQERLIEDIRGRLSNLKGVGSIDPMAVANELAADYSITIGGHQPFLISPFGALSRVFSVQ